MQDDRTDQQGAEPERRPGVPPHQPPPQTSDADRVDEGSEESFPSSDPPATGGPGV
ncbi:hypothetical protein [Miltoncostaea marina]|uniref:hypothetical protein n=1 Tax=Miltoncostaea marina TaxID=2843215 RepID=UPI001C3CCEE0|nr:hypothetical protein [Miltoncostaea marina]